MTQHESEKAEFKERAQRRGKVTQSPSKQLEARDPELKAMGDSPSVESPGVFRDARFSHPANIGHKIQVARQLQHSHGNAYVQRLLDPRAVQAKLVVNPPDDQYEQEADRVADTVVRSTDSQIQRQTQVDEEVEEMLQVKPATASSQFALQRQTEEKEEEEEEEVLQGKSDGTQAPPISEALEARIAAARDGGQPLDDLVRASIEPSFGMDLGDVRVHTDTEADHLSRNLKARAFTAGKDVFFRHGDYQPGSTEGTRLLAHELTHVAQQSETPSAPAKTDSAPSASFKVTGQTAARASGGKRSAVARHMETDVEIARQPEEVKGGAEAATPPPAMPAPPILTGAQATLWQLTVVSKIKEARRLAARKRPRWDLVCKAAMAGRDAIPPLIEATGVPRPTAERMRQVEERLNRVASMTASLLVSGIDVPDYLDFAMEKAKMVETGGAPAPMPK